MEDGVAYTPERVKAILRHPKDCLREERVDVGGVVNAGAIGGDEGCKLLALWAAGYTQAEALAHLGVKGRPSAIFRAALVKVADALNGKGGGA